MSLTDFIAFLAFIVALYGAILSTYTAIHEFFRLKVSVLDSSQTYATRTFSNSYISELGCRMGIYSEDLITILIPVRIVNKSKNSTTINEIILNNTYTLNSSSKVDNRIPISFCEKKNHLVCYSSKKFNYPVLKPLCHLEPLDTLEGFLVFSGLKEVPSHFKIKVKAVQKSKTFHLHFKIANDYRNEIVQE